MYKNIKIFFAFIVFCLLPICKAMGQDRKIKSANQAYENFAFVEAAKLYTDAINSGNNELEVYIRLGDCFYFNGNYSEAEKWYSKVVVPESSFDNEYYFRYAQALNHSNKYDQAASVMKMYYSKTGKEDVSSHWSEAEFLKELNKQSGRYNFKVVTLNSSASDFGSGFYGKGKIIYASAKDTGIVFKRTHKWNEKAYLKLYSADINSDGDLVNPKVLKGEINTKFHQSSAVVTKDGKTMYFTRSYSSGDKKGLGKDGITYLKICIANNENGIWKNVKELPFPVNTYGSSSAHPALSADEKELIFASDRNNKFGNTDLYVVSLKKDGFVGNDVKKLGDEINTLGKESYPFVDASGILYFSSDGHPGMGGLDVFAAIKDQNGIYHVVNVGSGVNSNEDDFAYGIQIDSKQGYFSSNREGDDNIYAFTESTPINFGIPYKPIVFGTITDNTGKPIQDVTVEVYTTEGEKVTSVFSDSQGKYSTELNSFKDYNFVYKKPSLIEITQSVPSMKLFEKKEINTELLNERQIVVGDKVEDIEDGKDLTKILHLDPIYFGLNGANIRESSRLELNKVIELMRKRPNILIKIKSYTDSRGRDEYNMALSKNRAKATFEYIVKAGIESDRLSYEGYGETGLLNECSNGVKCTEKEHEINRRSEFIVTWK